MSVKAFVLNRVVPTIVCLGFVPTSGTAQIYTYLDANGRLVLANKPEPATASVGTDLPASPAATAVSERKDSAATRDRKLMYEGLISEHARINDVRPELVKAVVQVESAYNPYAISPKGAQGLMQLMPGTAHQFGVRNAFNPEENVRAGVAYLRQLLDKYDNDEDLALAAYNAGPTAVDKYGQTVPPYRETKNYVAQIGQMTARPVEQRASAIIYKIVEIVDGQPRVRYTDKRPATGSYEIVGR
ncbi:MAG TPA: lytic transglycosylase domain-containing protein [Vicinamibacterales bacterium]|nr:lytic transglycosylase domain-containing protein [Vicinamibacterales bacterium]